MIRVKFSALALAAVALVLASATAAVAQEDAGQPNPPRQSWSFSGMFGIYDKAQLQRGFQVYKEVCSTCHALSIPFRTLTDPDARGYLSNHQCRAQRERRNLQASRNASRRHPSP